MRKPAILLTLALALGCGESKDPSQAITSDPVSVRGWVEDVAGAKRGETIELELYRRQGLFQQTSVWVEKSQFASGGIAENGSFIILDVPPGNTTIGFSAPGAENAKLILENVPGNADVLIPQIVLQNGTVKVLDPKRIQVRLPASVREPRDTGKLATVAGHPVRIIETPIRQLVDRRDYPDPGGFRPVAIVK
jgi:hypothetical protein